MFPGMVSKRSFKQINSAAVIGVDVDVLVIKGTTQINTITGAYSEYAQKITIIPADGQLVLGATGNIMAGATLPQNVARDLTWNPVSKKWHIHAISA